MMNTFNELTRLSRSNTAFWILLGVFLALLVFLLIFRTFWERRRGKEKPQEESMPDCERTTDKGDSI